MTKRMKKTTPPKKRKNKQKITLSVVAPKTRYHKPPQKGQIFESSKTYKRKDGKKAEE